jgi:hypothetical protein
VELLGTKYNLYIPSEWTFLGRKVLDNGESIQFTSASELAAIGNFNEKKAGEARALHLRRLGGTDAV